MKLKTIPGGRVRSCTRHSRYLSVKMPFYLLSLALALFLSGCGGAKPEEKKDPVLNAVAVETGVATTQSIEQLVQAQGTLAPGQGATVKISPVAIGRIASVRVKEGDHVSAGQIVAILDSRTGQAMSKSASAALNASQAQARQSATSAKALDTDSGNAIYLAELALKTAKSESAMAEGQAKTSLLAAETDLKKMQAGARPQEIVLAEQATIQAKATLDRVETEEERVRFLYDKGIDAKRVLDDAITAVKVAKSGLESARQQESLVKSGARAEDVRASEIKVQQAKELLTQAQSNGSTKIGQAQAALKGARDGRLNVEAKRQEAQAASALVRQKEADLSTSQIANSYAEIRSPVSGVVTKRNQNPGDIADPAVGIIEISNLASLNLTASLPADEGANLKAGMEAKISCQEFPGKEFSGRVVSVGQVDPLTNLLSIRVGVSSAPQLRSGLFATAEIVIRRIGDATVVPKKAIITKEGKTSLFVAGSDGIAKLREVEVGVEKDDKVQIVKGVSAGEKVITLGQFELAEGAKIKEAGAEEKADKGADKPEDKKEDKKGEPAKEADKGGAKPEGGK